MDDLAGSNEPEAVLVHQQKQFVKLLFCCLDDYLVQLVLPSCVFPSSQLLHDSVVEQMMMMMMMVVLLVMQMDFHQVMIGFCCCCCSCCMQEEEIKVCDERFRKRVNELCYVGNRNGWI